MTRSIDWFLKVAAVLAIAFGAVFGANQLDVETVKVKRSKPCPDEMCPESYPCPDRASNQSGEYPQISGLSDNRFQERINYDIRKQAEEFLSGGGDDEAKIGFTVLQNDGEIFAVKLWVGYEGSLCTGGNHWSTNDNMITIDVLKNKNTSHRFSRRGNPLYPYSEVTMSVSEINRIIATYEHKDENCDMSISNKKDGTFVIVDGNVAIEVELDFSCAKYHAAQGIHAIPLYKVVSKAPSSGMFTDIRDNKTYKTVQIGGKTWMAWNLNYQTESSWCYNNDNSNCDKYGRLYAWNVARGACPSGWQLPSRQEWNDLVATVGDPSAAGKKLKAKRGWGNNGNGMDDYGFLALPGGNRRVDGSFENAGIHGFWWTATSNDGSSAYNRRMGDNSNHVVEYSNSKDNGYSVRCVQSSGENVKTDIGTNFSHINDTKSQKRRQSMFGWLIFITVAVIVLAVIIVKFKISPYLENLRSTEMETKKDADRAFKAVDRLKDKFNDLISAIKNANSVYVSAKARELLEEATAIVNKLSKPIKDAVTFSVDIANIRLKRSIAAFERSVVISEQAEEMAKKLEKEVDAAKDLYDQATKEEEIASIEESAEYGDAKAKYDVSKWYLDVKNNLERYMYWLRKSAEQGYAVAQRKLGTMYFEGTDPLKKDINEALVWLEKAAGQDGLPPMTKEVADWFRLYGGRGDSDFYVLLSLAVGLGRKDVMEWLFSLRSDIDVNRKDKDGLSLLHIAALSGGIEVMSFLLDHGADVEARDGKGKTPIFALANAGHTDALKWLVNERGASVEARDSNGRTPIFSAVRNGKVDVIRCLKEDLRASVLIRDSDGMSPMECAVVNGQIESIKCLNQLGANVNAKNGDGKTPLFAAAITGETEAIKCLASLGADVNAIDNVEVAPILAAAQAGQLESMICLKELGADINARNSIGMTPIFVAAGGSMSNPAVIEYLVSQGVDVNAKLKNGMTPIFFAADGGQLENVKCLVRLGADVNVEAKNMTPLTLAVQGGHTVVANYLRANGAR